MGNACWWPTLGQNNSNSSYGVDRLLKGFSQTEELNWSQATSQNLSKVKDSAGPNAVDRDLTLCHLMDVELWQKK